MSRGIRARIDLSALQHNLRRARDAAPASRVMAVVKAGGYGHGLLEVARALNDADAFAVEDTGEGERLRQAGIDRDIVLLSGFHDAEELDTINRCRLSPVIHHDWQIGVLERADSAAPTRVWIKADTGMHRAGFAADRIRSVARSLEAIAHVEIKGVMSHLARADDLTDPATDTQCRLLKKATTGLSYPLSLANSPGVLGWPDTHLAWIRPGMMLYGCSPLQDQDEEDLDLRPAMTLESRIIATGTVEAGETIGYGGTWRCETRTRVGLLACGYGDGYPRHAPSGTPVSVNGLQSRVLGRVSMDLITIDLSECGDAKIGDWVELWGSRVPASAVAAHAGTIPYELVTRVAPRVPRIYE